MNNIELHISCQGCQKSMGVMVMFFSGDSLAFDAVYVCSECDAKLDQEQGINAEFERIIEDL